MISNDDKMLVVEDCIFHSDGERRGKGIRWSVSFPLRSIQDLKKSMEIFPLSSVHSGSHRFRACFVVKHSFPTMLLNLLSADVRIFFFQILINLYNLWPLAEPFFCGTLFHCMRDCMVESCSGNYS